MKDFLVDVLLKPSLITDNGNKKLSFQLKSKTEIKMAIAQRMLVLWRPNKRKGLKLPFDVKRPKMGIRPL